ncbi:MAG: pyridoxamine 5'-phosphate oxidase family protein [Salibacteraceae bacterium]
MSKKFSEISPKIQDFIERQKMFFVGTAMREGTVNISPKGLDSFRVLDKNTVVWMNLTGSGNETATHLLQSNRMTVMFCAFEGAPNILRLYGTCEVFHPRDAEFEKFAKLFPADVGSRQVMLMKVDLVQTSCGYAVPLMEYKADRTILSDWSSKQGPERVKNYWKEKNTISLDGHPTQIFKDKIND